MDLRRNFAAAVVIAAAGSLPATATAGALYFYEMSNASEAGYGGVGLAARANDAGTAFTNPAGPPPVICLVSATLSLTAAHSGTLSINMS